MLDKQNLQLLVELIADSTKPQKNLAGDLGVSTPAISRMRKVLEKDGIIKGYTTLIDYKKIGYATTAYFLFRENDRDRKHSENTVKFLLQIPEIIEINKVLDPATDFVLKLMCNDNEHLIKIVEQIHGHDNVDSSSARTLTIGMVEKGKLGVDLNGSAGQGPISPK